MKRNVIFLLITFLGFCPQANGQTGTITTVAGNGSMGFSGDGGPAISAGVYPLGGVALDRAGNLFIADIYYRVRMVSASGIITTVAGNGTAGFSGDGGPATAASLSIPRGVAVDASGNLFIADSYNNRVRMVSASGIITTVAGNGTAGFSGDGGPATAASLNYPVGVAVDASGNLFIADSNNNRVRKVSASGIITTVAGNGKTSGASGDGGPATSAPTTASTVAVDASGNLFIADSGNNRVRMVSASGIITTVAGNGRAGFSGDGGPATSAGLDPYGIAVDVFGNLFIADISNFRVRKVSASGIITTVAGNGRAGFSGDGGPATSASLSYPSGLALDSSGNLFIAVDYRVREVSGQGPSLGVSPASLSFSLQPGGSATQHVTLVSAVGVVWNASTSSSWITVTPTSGATPSTISVTVNTASLQPGTYTGSIVIANPSVSPPQETVAISLTAIQSAGQSGVIITIAGTGVADSLANGETQFGAFNGGATGDGGPATVALLSGVTAMAADASGSLFIADSYYNNRIRKVSSSGVINTVAGFGGYNILCSCGPFSGDGGPAPLSGLFLAQGVAVDSSGNLFIADSNNYRIRKVSGNGIITTVAGNGSGALDPWGLAADSSGNLFFADRFNNQIRELFADGTITTIAGSGSQGYSGDGGPATSAQLSSPSRVAVDASGNIFFVDQNNQDRHNTPVVRRVTHGGTINTIAGGSTASNLGDGGPANFASVVPVDVAVDSFGNLFIADSANNRIRMVSSDGVITTVVGNGAKIFSGDGGPASEAGLSSTDAIAVDMSGNLFIVDGYRIREVPALVPAIVNTVAGTGTTGFSGDGGPAISAELFRPQGAALDSSGNLFIADTENNRVREVSIDGSITTVAGNGATGFSGDGGPATSATLSSPSGIAIDTSGNLFIADTGNQRIRQVSPSGTISTVAGNGTQGFSGDRGPALSASLSAPTGVAVDVFGNLFISDRSNNRVRRVSVDGSIVTVAGSPGVEICFGEEVCFGNPFSGDGGPATSATLNLPQSVAIDASGNLFIADSGNNRIRRVSPNGTITTVVGGNISAPLKSPGGIATDALGNLFIADSYNNRIWRVPPGGAPMVVAGAGPSTTCGASGCVGGSFAGDGGAAVSASFNLPQSVVVDGSGNLFIADTRNNRIREVFAVQASANDSGTAAVGEAELSRPLGRPRQK